MIIYRFFFFFIWRRPDIQSKDWIFIYVWILNRLQKKVDFEEITYKN